jgi:hypothetical protein
MVLQSQLHEPMFWTCTYLGRSLDLELGKYLIVLK